MVKLASPSIDTEWLRRLSETSGVSYEKLYALYHECGYDKEMLVSSLKTELAKPPKEAMPKVIVFLNGMLVKNVFYDFEKQENGDLLGMLEKNEFDRDIFESAFGHAGKYTDLVIERREETYTGALDMTNLKRNIEKPNGCEVNKKRKTEDRKLDEKARCSMGCTSDVQCTSVNVDEADSMPEKITIGKPPSVKFKVIFKNKESTVFIDPSLKIVDIVAFFFIHYKLKVSIAMAGEILDEHESVLVLKNSMVELHEHAAQTRK